MLHRRTPLVLVHLGVPEAQCGRSQRARWSTIGCCFVRGLLHGPVGAQWDLIIFIAAAALRATPQPPTGWLPRGTSVCAASARSGSPGQFCNFWMLGVSTWRIEKRGRCVQLLIMGMVLRTICRLTGSLRSLRTAQRGQDQSVGSVYTNAPQQPPQHHHHASPISSGDFWGCTRSKRMSGSMLVRPCMPLALCGRAFV